MSRSRRPWPWSPVDEPGANGVVTFELDETIAVGGTLDADDRASGTTTGDPGVPMSWPRSIDDERDEPRRRRLLRSGPAERRRRASTSTRPSPCIGRGTRARPRSTPATSWPSVPSSAPCADLRLLVNTGPADRRALHRRRRALVQHACSAATRSSPASSCCPSGRRSRATRSPSWRASRPRDSRRLA